MTKADFVKTLTETMTNFSAACRTLNELSHIANTMAVEVEDAVHAAIGNSVADYLRQYEYEDDAPHYMEIEEMEKLGNIAWRLNNFMEAVGSYRVSDAYRDLGNAVEKYVNA